MKKVNGNGEFKQHLLKYEIKPILARVKHPQTNDKIEKWFHTYERFRNDFSSFDEFIEWYNNLSILEKNAFRSLFWNRT
jgi:putative transposase